MFANATKTLLYSSKWVRSPYSSKWVRSPQRTTASSLPLLIQMGEKPLLKSYKHTSPKKLQTYIATYIAIANPP